MIALRLMTRLKRQRRRKRQRVCFLPPASALPEKGKNSDVCKIHRKRLRIEPGDTKTRHDDGNVQA